jgi:hypothetical protein
MAYLENQNNLLYEEYKWLHPNTIFHQQREYSMVQTNDLTSKTLGDQGKTNNQKRRTTMRLLSGYRMQTYIGYEIDRLDYKFRWKTKTNPNNYPDHNSTIHTETEANTDHKINIVVES